MPSLTITLQEHQTILTNVTLQEYSDLISQWWSMRICRNIWKQESIPVRYALPACQPYMFWWLPIGVSTSGDEGWVFQVPWYTNTHGNTDPTPPGHTPHLDIPPRHIPHPSGHTHPLLVTLGGHHWKHTDPSPAPHFEKQTDTCENITFPQPCWKAVIKEFDMLVIYGITNLCVGFCGTIDISLFL